MEELKVKFEDAMKNYFLPLSKIEDTIRTKPVEEMLPESEQDRTIYGFCYPVRCFDFANLALAYGDKAKSRQFAEWGLSKIELRPAFKEPLEKLAGIA